MVVVWGSGVGGQNMAEANGGIGCEGASGLPRQSRHNRHAYCFGSSIIKPARVNAEKTTKSDFLLNDVFVW